MCFHAVDIYAHLSIRFNLPLKFKSDALRTEMHQLNSFEISDPIRS